MVSIAAPSLWQWVYELGAKQGQSGMFYYLMALVQAAKLVVSFTFLNGTHTGVAGALVKSKAA